MSWRATPLLWPAVLAGLLAACGCGSSGNNASAQRPSELTEERDETERPTTPPVQSGRPQVELGELPYGFVIAWPELPRVEREVHVRSEQDAAAARRTGTRLLIHEDVDRVVIGADDVELVVDDDARVGRVLIEKGHGRIRIAGGRYGVIELQIPGRHVPPPVTFRSEWRVHDVTIEDVDIDADDTALYLRGQRIAVVNSRANAERYAVWSGDTGDFQSEDIILAGNRFDSAGPESTVRLVAVNRAVVVDNVLENSRKHDFRVHGESDQIFFARNTLLNTGIMVGSMDGDRVGSVWLVDNVFHHRVPSLLQAPPERIERLVARGNRVYSDRWDCFVCGQSGAGWEVGENPCAAYRPPE